MIRVLIAEDTVILRETLVAVLDLQPDITVVAEVGSGDQILAAAEQSAPDVAMLDIDLPGMDGLTAADRLQRRHPGCRVLVLTGLARPAHLRAALSVGVCGFLPKNTPATTLIDAIRKIATGGTVIDSELAAETLTRPANPLTPREADVLRHYAGGSTPREIAQTLSLSYGTVRNYLAAATDKVGGRSRLDAIRIARENSWI
jgi:two-component system response regulator DesR